MAQKQSAANPRKSKTTFSLDMPYTEVKWPVISVDDQPMILEMLCSLLSPIGEYRSQHIVPSKGKREKKRKRKEKFPPVEPGQDAAGDHAPRAADVPEPPDMQKYLTIGFNSTKRYLESLAQGSAPNITYGQQPMSSNVVDRSANASDSDKPNPIVAVFVPRSDHPPILYSHLPLLIKTASLASPSSPPPRLVMLPKGAEERLSAALSIPRAGLIGLLDGAPNSDSFIEFVRQQVPEVEVPWLHEAAAGAYMPVNIKAIQTSAPATQKKHKLDQAPPPMGDD